MDEQIFHAIPVPATLIDCGGIIRAVNDAFVEQARRRGRQVRPEDRVGRHVAEFVIGADRRRQFEAFIQQVLANGQGDYLRWESRLGTGRPFWVDIRARVVRDGEGAVDGALILREDVTERVLLERRAELAGRLRDRIWRMQSARDMEGVMTVMRDGLRELGVPFYACGVNLVDADADPPSFLFHNMTDEGWTEGESTLASKIVLRLWREGVTAYRGDLRRDDPFGERQNIRNVFSPEVFCIVDVPFARGTLAANSLEPDAFSATDVEILEQMAGVLEEGFERLADLESMRQSEARYRAVVRQSADCIFLVDLDTKQILEANPVLGRLLGYEPDEVEGLNLYDVVAHDRDSVDAHIERLREDRQRAIGERQYRRKDGSLVDVDVTVSLIEDEDREVGCVVSRDITERRRRERQQQALQLVRDRVWSMQSEKDLDSVLAAVERALKALGIEFEHFGINLITSSISRSNVRVHSTGSVLDLAESGASLLAGVWQRGEPLYRPDLLTDDPHGERQDILSGYGKSIRSVVDVPFSHGTLAVNSLRPHAFSEADIAAIRQLADVLSDGFRRTDDLRQLSLQREQLLVTLRSLGEGVISTDTDGCIVLVNATAERLTGWSQAQATGRPLGEVFRLEDEQSGKALSDPAAEVLQRGGTEVSRVGLLAAGDRKRPVAASAAPIRDEGSRVTGVVLVFHDVTAQRRTQEERTRADKLESLGVLAGGIAHDFNNILTGITGNLSMALTHVESGSSLAGVLDEAERASVRAARLTAQLLTFARGGTPVLEVVSLGEAIREAATFALRGSNVEGEFDLEEGLWLVEADPGQLAQVIQNLVINADQAMPDGGTVRIAARNVARGSPLEGACVRVDVADTGTGIPPALRGRIFEPYFTTKEGGTGLGLATAYAIVQSHGGLIRVDSEVGRGTVFTLFLPARQGAAPAATEAPDDVPGGEGRVLVMDDEETIRSLLTSMLGQLGYRCVTTAEGGEALEAYARAREEDDPFDAVILDLTIPGGMGGVDTMARLQATDPQVTAIVSSGYSSDPVMANHRDYGFAGMVRKPYRMADMARALATAIEGRRAAG